MASEDRELLELAAKAAGLSVRWDEHWRRFQRDARPVSPGYSEWVLWRPLMDDGDALWLAVKLGMNVHVVSRDGVFVSRYATEPVIAEKHDGDLLAATRRAITRLAAHIGKNMPAGGDHARD